MGVLDRAKIVLAKHGITSAQADVLRKAARKYKDYVPKGAFYGGEVSTYAVRQDTLDALLTRRLIVKELVHKEDREERLKHAEGLIDQSFSDAKTYDPYSKPYPASSDPNWKHILAHLKAAEETFKSLQLTCLRITDAGRAVAKEWKEAIGAEEE